jgi:small subunit ribosomal protein S4
MARDLGSSCRLCRREGEKLFLKGTRCYTHRCAIERRDYAPGDHGAKRASKLSNFGIQMREKQKLKRIYGLLEKQFRLYFASAVKSKGVTGSILLQLLERRLDNVIYRLGFATSRKQARQIVSHGFVCINDRSVNISSVLVKQNDEISFKITANQKGQKLIQESFEVSKARTAPTWLAADSNHLKGKILRLPERDDINFPINEQLIIELYSR